MNFLHPFQTKTCDTITAPITKIVDELLAHGAVHDDLARKHFEEIDHHHALADASVNESEKAGRNAAAIAKMFG